jgi:hypothetical protein
LARFNQPAVVRLNNLYLEDSFEGSFSMVALYADLGWPHGSLVQAFFFENADDATSGPNTPPKYAIRMPKRKI